MNLLDLLKVFWISFAASAIVAWPIYRWLKGTVKQKIDPYAPETHQAKQGTPTMGGLIILVGAVVGYCSIPNFAPREPGSVKGDLSLAFHGLALIILLVGLGLIGFADDFIVPRVFAGKRGLGWKQKLIPEILAATLASYATYGERWGAIVFAAFCVLFYSNAFNFADGLDGLAGSIWAGLTLGLVLLLAAPNYFAISAVIIAILGGAVVFLWLNAPPAKVFMGDVASLPLGAVLGYAVSQLLLPAGWKGGPLAMQTPMIVPILILSLLMIAELVPVPMQVAYYKLTKGKRLFPATPIHHGFEKKGWPESRVTWTFALFQLLLSLAAVTVHLAQQGYWAGE